MGSFASFILGLVLGAFLVAVLLKFDFKAAWDKLFKKKE